MFLSIMLTFWAFSFYYVGFHEIPTNNVSILLYVWTVSFQNIFSRFYYLIYSIGLCFLSFYCSMWCACSDLIFICWHEHWLLLCISSESSFGNAIPCYAISASSMYCNFSLHQLLRSSNPAIICCWIFSKSLYFKRQLNPSTEWLDWSLWAEMSRF